MRSTRLLSRALLIFFSSLPIMIFCFCAGESAFYIAVSVAVHECAHLFAMRLLGVRLGGFRPAPFGLCMEYRLCEASLWGELFINAAGCLANLATFVAAVIVYRFFAVDFLMLGTVSALMGLVNLIPVYPLDGYGILHVLVSLKWGPFAAERVLGIVSYAVGFICFLFSAYMLVTDAKGIYPLLFSVYIFAGNAKMWEKNLFL